MNRTLGFLRLLRVEAVPLSISHCLQSILIMRQIEKNRFFNNFSLKDKLLKCVNCVWN